MGHPDRALFRAFAHLTDLPHVALGTFPTPVEALDLAEIVPTFGGRAWVKREDHSAPGCGGNKVRKLEFLLGRARERGARTVVTVGGVGSNHCLATAYHAPEADLEAHLVIFPHDVTPSSRRTLRAMCALGPRITYAPSANAAAAYALALSARRHRPFPLLPGGSSPTGVLGYVNAGLELAEQVHDGELEVPDAVVLAYGSGGSAAGLALGLQLGGLSPLVVAVRVYPMPATSAWWLRHLAASALRRLGAGTRFDASRLRVVGDYLGAGYATPTEAGSAAREAAATVGLELEPTYTAKAFAAFLDLAAGRRWRDSRLLFVQTYDATPGHELGEDASLDLVPARLRAYA